MNEKTYHKTLEQLKSRNLIEERDDVYRLTGECFQSFKEKTREFFNIPTDKQCNTEDCIDGIIILTILETGPAFGKDMRHMWSVLKILLFAYCPKLEKIIIDDTSKGIAGLDKKEIAGVDKKLWGIKINEAPTLQEAGYLNENDASDAIDKFEEFTGDG